MTVKAMAATIELNGSLDFVMCRSIHVVFTIYGVVDGVSWCLMAVSAFIGMFDIVVLLFVRRRKAFISVEF
jgi:hypothetical protein